MTASDRPVVTRRGDEQGDTAQSGGLSLVTGVGPQHTPATRIWFGKASNPPGFRSLRIITARRRPAPIYCPDGPVSISARVFRNIWK